MVIWQASIGNIFGRFTSTGSEACRFQEEGGPAVVRKYESMKEDPIYVQEPNNPNHYISLDKHLSAIQNGYDKRIEEARIKKQVGW